jgi:hypothetical protein
LSNSSKTTLIGGLLIILPIYVSVILIAKVVQGIVAAMKPITAVVPADGSRTTHFDPKEAFLTHARGWSGRPGSRHSCRISAHASRYSASQSCRSSENRLPRQ